jgi:hypothetical protein
MIHEKRIHRKKMDADLETTMAEIRMLHEINKLDFTKVYN